MATVDCGNEDLDEDLDEDFKDLKDRKDFVDTLLPPPSPSQHTRDFIGTSEDVGIGI